jgi:hypothetical protein
MIGKVPYDNGLWKGWLLPVLIVLGILFSGCQRTGADVTETKAITATNTPQPRLLPTETKMVSQPTATVTPEPLQGTAADVAGGWVGQCEGGDGLAVVEPCPLVLFLSSVVETSLIRRIEAGSGN